MAHAFTTGDGKAAVSAETVEAQRRLYFQTLFNAQLQPLLEIIDSPIGSEISKAWMDKNFNGARPSHLYLRVITCFLHQHTKCTHDNCDCHHSTFIIPFNSSAIRFFVGYVRSGHMPDNTSELQWLWDKLGYTWDADRRYPGAKNVKRPAMPKVEYQLWILI